MKYLISLLFLFSTSCIIAQELDTYMQEVREGSYKPIPNEILEATDQTALFNDIESYLSDTLEIIRSKAYYIIKRVGQRSENGQLRSSAIAYLINGVRDQSSGVSGNASEALAGFKKEDFTDSHKEAIADLVEPTTPHLDQVLKLAGSLIPSLIRTRLLNINGRPT